MITEFEMPTPCQNCGEIFDLHDGLTSKKWFKNTIICEKCADLELFEIEKDDKIENLKIIIDDAVCTIMEAKRQLLELGVDCEIDLSEYKYYY